MARQGGEGKGRVGRAENRKFVSHNYSVHYTWAWTWRVRFGLSGFSLCFIFLFFLEVIYYHV